jgi:hypothetical protein
MKGEVNQVTAVVIVVVVSYTGNENTTSLDTTFAPPSQVVLIETVIPSVSFGDHSELNVNM